MKVYIIEFADSIRPSLVFENFELFLKGLASTPDHLLKGYSVEERIGPFVVRSIGSRQNQGRMN